MSQHRRRLCNDKPEIHRPGLHCKLETASGPQDVPDKLFKPRMTLFDCFAVPVTLLPRQTKHRDTQGQESTRPLDRLVQPFHHSELERILRRLAKGWNLAELGAAVQLRATDAASLRS